MTDDSNRVHTGAMRSSQYMIVDRYELPCSMCDGEGCLSCRNGSVPVYVLVAAGSTARCWVLGHNLIGHTERAEDIKDLPHVAWCLRCGHQQVHTDVPEAYDLGAQQTA